MTQKNLNSLQTPAPGIGRRIMDVLGFAIIFAGFMVQWVQGDDVGGILVISFGLFIYTLPRMYYRSDIRFDKKSEGKWENASLEDYQKIIKQLDLIAKTHRFMSAKISLILFYVVCFILLVFFYGETTEEEIALLIIIDVLTLGHMFYHYKSPAPHPEGIQQRLSAFECITAFHYPEDFKLQIQFQMKKLEESERLAPFDIRFSIDYRHKSPEWFSLSLVTLLKPAPFFCYAVFIATEPSPVFSAFEGLTLPSGWSKKAKLEKTYPSLAITYGNATNVGQILNLLTALIQGISSDAFQEKLKANAKNADEGDETVEKLGSDDEN